MFSWESFHAICTLLIVASVNQHSARRNKWPSVPLSFRIFLFSDLVWMYIKPTLSVLARSLLVALYERASVLRFRRSHNLTLVVTWEMSNQWITRGTETRRGKRKIFLKQAGTSTIQNRNTTIGHRAFFLSARPHINTISAGAALLGCVVHTKTHFIHKKRVPL